MNLFQRSPNLHSQNHLVQVRSPAKMIDDKNFNINQVSTPVQPPVLIRSCPTPSKVFHLPASQTPLPAKMVESNCDPTVEQLVPERDTNTSKNANLSLTEVCAEEKSSLKAIVEDNVAGRNFKFQQQQHYRLASQAISNSVKQQVTVAKTVNNTGTVGRNHLHHHLSVEELRLIQV